MSSTQASKIAALNDQFRTTGVGGQILMTAGIAALPYPEQAVIMHRVQTFADFNPDNDPHAEHDFGSFSEGDQTIFWKIDCYDLSMKFGSEDPADPKVTTRVLTVMFAHEY